MSVATQIATAQVQTAQVQMAQIAAAQTGPGGDAGGLTGLVLDVVDRLGEIGVGLLVLVETVFPPLPSEVILPLGGYLARRGRLDLTLLLVLATVGSLLGAWALYLLGRRLGRDRAAAALARVPLLDREDLERAFDWFDRHGAGAVFFGRLIPGVRSLISVPAGAAAMSAVRFSLFTTLGSLLWNALLIGGGYLLGSQYELIDRYSAWLDRAMIAAVVITIGWLVVRRIRRGRQSGSPTPTAPAGRARGRG